MTNAINVTQQSMQAAVYKEYGPPEVLSVKTVGVPGYADNEILIRVHYSTVNRTDCGFLRAKPFIVRLIAGLTKPKSTILGSEFSGEVVATGHAVTDYQIGDHVFGFKDDDHGFGGHAQFTTMPENAMMAKIPDHLSYREAAAALEGAHYALVGIRSAKIGQGQHILINGATGAIGSAALQIIHAMGAKVTAVCAKPHAEKIRLLGAVKTIDYLSEDFTQQNEQFDVVVDAVGKSTFRRCKRILKAQGIYTSTEFGPYMQNPLLALLTPLFSKQTVRFPIPYKNPREDANYLADLMQRNQFMPLIDRTYSLDDIQEAFRYVESGEKIGNVLIELP